MQGAAINFFTNAAAGTSAKKAFDGGKCVLVAMATWGGGSAKLQLIMADGSTAADVANSTMTANGMTGALDLPPGQYQVVTATGSAFYVDLVRIPS